MMMRAAWGLLLAVAAVCGRPLPGGKRFPPLGLGWRRRLGQQPHSGGPPFPLQRRAHSLS